MVAADLEVAVGLPVAVAEGSLVEVVEVSPVEEVVVSVVVAVVVSVAAAVVAAVDSPVELLVVVAEAEDGEDTTHRLYCLLSAFGGSGSFCRNISFTSCAS